MAMVVKWAHGFPLCMSQKPVAKALHDVAEKIAAATFHGRILRDMLPHELLPIIRSSLALNEEYERRVHYYERLATGGAYLSLRDDLIATVWEVHPHIRRDLLVSPVAFWLPMKGRWSLGQIGKSLSVQQFYDALPTPEWCDLGETFGSNIETPDSRLCPWVAVLEQFQEVVKLVGVAEALSAIADVGRPSSERLRRLVGKLTALLQTPWHSLHIGDFEDLHCYIIMCSPQEGYEHRTSKFLHDEDSPVRFAETQDCASVVCHDLLVYLEKPQEARRMRYDPKTRTFFYKNRTLQLPRKADYAALCDAFYPNCPKSGRMKWQAVMEHINKIAPDKTYGEGREKIREWVRSLNRWAVRPKHFGEEIVELGDDLVRLK